MRPCDELTYDAEADALYITLACEWSARADEHDTLIGLGGVNVDVVGPHAVGIEVLHASKHPVFSSLIPKIDGATLRSFKSGGVHPRSEEG